MISPRTQSVVFQISFLTRKCKFYRFRNREKEREEYRKAQIAEETKIKLLQDIEKKDFFFDKTENQKEQIVSDIEKGKLEDAKKPKKNKSIEAQKSAKEQDKNKVQSAAAVKAEKRKINLKGE